MLIFWAEIKSNISPLSKALKQAIIVYNTSRASNLATTQLFKTGVIFQN